MAYHFSPLSSSSASPPTLHSSSSLSATSMDSSSRLFSNSTNVENTNSEPSHSEDSSKSHLSDPMLTETSSPQITKYRQTPTTMTATNLGEFDGDFLLYDHDHDQPEIHDIIEPSRVQRHVQDMSTFLERSEEILYGGPSIRLQKPIEVSAIHDRSEPLPDITDFSGTEWPSESSEMGDSSMDDMTTLHDIHNRLDKFEICSSDSALGETNSRRNSYEWNNDFSALTDRRYSTDTDSYSYGSCVSPISIKQDIPIINCNDSGVYSTSFESTGRQSVLKQSPFMGHVDSPDDPYSTMDWPGIAFPQKIFRSPSTEMEPMSPPSPELQNLPLFPDLPDDGLLSRPRSQAASSRQTTPFTSTSQTLSSAGREAIARDILTPLMKNRNLSVFHQLFRQVQEGMSDGSIACLRDLEKDLFQHGHDSANCTGPLFLRLFHEFFACCRRALPGVPEEDQCRPTDTEQYCPSYYLDAWHRIFGHVQAIWKLKPSQSERIVKEMQLDPTGGRLKNCPKRGKTLPPYSSLKRSMPGPGPPPGYPYTSKKRGQRSACSASEQTPDQVSATASASTLIIQPSIMTTTMALSNTPNSAFALDDLSINAPLGSNNHMQPIYMTSPTNTSFIYDTETRTAQTEVHLGRREQEVRYSGVAEIPAGGVGIAGPPLSPGSPSTVDWNTNNQSLSPATTGENYEHDHNREFAQEPNSNMHVCNVCKKSYTRMCDLRKHSKTHERPYKCHEKTCYYASRGFSAEKDRDRHFHDKHDKNQKKHECHWKCGYSSTRLSNVKQHMEKTHGFTYVRSKSVKNKPTLKQSQSRGALAVQRSPRVTKKSPPIQSPQGRVIGSFDNTPATLPSHSPTGLELLSPHTLQASPISMFNRLPSPPLHPQGIAPEVIQSHTPTSLFENEPVPSSFNDPLEAITAINRQKHSPEAISVVTAFTQNAINNPLHDEYTRSPNEEFEMKQIFADDFLRDAPAQHMAMIQGGYPIRIEPFNEELDRAVENIAGR